MGVELPRPVVNDRCLELNFTNEGGVGETFRLLKNIGGLWLVQECRRIWAKQGCEFTWEALMRLSSEAQPLVSLVNPDDATLLAPVDMTQSIRDFCRRTGQPQPADEGAMVRCALESLALRYRQVLGHLEELAGTRINTIHIVGGGALNRQLCQFTADACNRRVIAGPVEATAIGNVMMQAVASGAVKDIAEAREVVRHSFSVEEYEPSTERGAWEAAYGVFERVTG
jgi:rhamnulokinase